MSDIAETLRHAGLASPQRVASPFEFWPAALFYAPVAAYWAWQSLRYRSITLPSIANPLMEYGGLCGESKIALFESMSPAGREWLAPYVSLERGEAARLAEDVAELLRLAEEAGLTSARPRVRRSAGGPARERRARRGAPRRAPPRRGPRRGSAGPG